MAESLMDIKRRIASTKKTGQITHAMQKIGRHSCRERV